MSRLLKASRLVDLDHNDLTRIFVLRLPVIAALCGLAIAATLNPASAQTATGWVTTSGPVMSGPVCPKCGRVHGAVQSTGVSPVSYSSPVQMASPTVSSPMNAAPTNSSPTLYGGGGNPNLRPSAGGGVSNVLSALNQQRSRQGLSALGYDPQLQAVAQRRAQLMASTGQKSHPPGSFAPGRYEGVGWNSSYSPAGVSACFTSDPNMRVAGAAMATGRDGVYFCVVYR